MKRALSILAALFEPRMDVVCQVAEFKKQQQMPIFQGGREQVVLGKTRSYIKNPDYGASLESFMTHLMGLSKDEQAKRI